jgi:hypothetical protein
VAPWWPPPRLRRSACLSATPSSTLRTRQAWSAEGPSTSCSPYLGNAPLLRWGSGDAARVVITALTEALRQCHARAVLDRRTQPGDVVFSVPPEALTLCHLPPDVRRVIYPDPPLPREELDELAPVHVLDADLRARPIELTTPLSQLARHARASALDLVGLSLSAAPDIDAYGGSAAHLSTVADDLVIMLLIAEMRLAYGGTIGYPGGPVSSINYASRMFALVRSYSPLAARYGSQRIHPIENFVAWPRHLAFGDAELAAYGREAQLVRIARPALAVSDAELTADANGWFPADSPTRPPTRRPQYLS